MVRLSFASLITALVQRASAHCTPHLSLFTTVANTPPDVFSRFYFNNTITDQWEYVRQAAATLHSPYFGPLHPLTHPSNISIGESPDSGLWDQYMPLYNLSSPSIRCGRGAHLSGHTTKVAQISPGDEVGFFVGRSAMDPLPPLIYHPGPAQVYLSRSPTEGIHTYHGDDAWFKITYFGPVNDTAWSTRDEAGVRFTIPKGTPEGEYLLRVEHLYVRYPRGMTQFYVGCAQVEVKEGKKGYGGEELGEEYMVRFPGGYEEEDEGIAVPEYMYEWPHERLTEYKPPGPPVWKGAG